MSKKIKREILFYTDDEQEAFEILGVYQSRGHKDLTVGRVRSMLDPPDTTYKFIIFRVKEL